MALFAMFFFDKLLRLESMLTLKVMVLSIGVPVLPVGDNLSRTSI